MPRQALLGETGPLQAEREGADVPAEIWHTEYSILRGHPDGAAVISLQKALTLLQTGQDSERGRGGR